MTPKEIELNKLYEYIATELDITEPQYQQAIDRYKAMGNWLAEDTSKLRSLSPAIKPQGSFLLGTVVKPITEEGDIDVDLVCELKKKPVEWTQEDVKEAVGNRIKSNDTYRSMLDNPDGGRRCWTINYADDKFHMDILPSIVNDEYLSELKLLSKDIHTIQDLDKLSMRITDKKAENYYTDQDTSNWLKTNPFGYSIWFHRIATLTLSEAERTLFESAIYPVPQYQKTKTPLQRAIQLLKRHRDMRMGDDEDKPISIIITTLATLTYEKYKGKTIYETLQNITNHITEFIIMQNGIIVIPNPVNPEENFADKWNEKPCKYEKFKEWVRMLDKDLNSVLNKDSIPEKSSILQSMFDIKPVNKALERLGREMKNRREEGIIGIDPNGHLSENGSIKDNPNHTFHD